MISRNRRLVHVTYVALFLGLCWSSLFPRLATAQDARKLTAAELFRVASPAIVRVLRVDEQGRTRGQGTGFFVSEEGTLITNFHVVRGGASWRVVMEDDRTLPVIGVTAQNPGADLAVLKVDGHWFRHLPRGPSEYPTPGEKVVAIGNPLGLTNTISDGLLSGYRLRGDQPRLMQISAPISNGSSGGPLFLDGQPEVIGVTSSGIQGGQNLNFAIPVREVNRLIRDLDQRQSVAAGRAEIELIGAIASRKTAEVVRELATDVGFRQMAGGTVGGEDETAYVSIDLDPRLLRAGRNVVAVEVHQASATSSDMGFDLEMTARTDEPTTLVAKGADWKYLDDGSDQGIRWRSVDFDDDDWKTGAAPLGYGDGHVKTTIEYGEQDDKHVTAYFRRRFELDDPDRVKRLRVSLLRDDAAVIYVNGEYAASDNIDFSLNVNAADKEGRTPLHAAAKVGDVEIIGALLAEGATVNQRANDGKTPLDLAVEEGHDEASRALRAAGAVDGPTAKRVDRLIAAARAGTTATVETLIGEGLNVNAVNDRGATALHYAAFAGKSEMVEKLIASGGDCAIADVAGFRPLHLAAKMNGPGIAARLLAAGADIDAGKSDGETALMEAVRAGSVEVLEQLIENGADLDRRTKSGMTALHLALRNPRLVRILVEKGADVEAADNTGATPLKLAIRQKYGDAIDILRQSGAVEPPVEPIEAKFPGDVTNSIGMAFREIKPGQFTMGSPDDEDGRSDRERTHKVTITKPYYIGVTEVTRGQFAEFIQATGHQPFTQQVRVVGRRGNQTIVQIVQISWRGAGIPQSDDHPVIMVSWNDARAFCEWLSKKEEKTYRLPTEAEWEFACRAGTTTRYHGGDDVETLKKMGWCNYDGGSATGRSTKEVGSFEANAWGLYDMHGNVHEWVADRFEPFEPSEATDPTGPERGETRVRRGGSWSSGVDSCRSAYRNHRGPEQGANNLGFRVVLEP